jgi:glycosyltransferase involved in cell wall biosynthesis
MVFFDITKTSRQHHASGITRTAQRLGDSLGSVLGESFVRVSWNNRRRTFGDVDRRRAVVPTVEDWFLTVEPFAPAERPGFQEFLEQGLCRFGAVFHDAIPLRYPEFTWPKSVARYPAYMKMLSAFDHVFGVSSSSCKEFEGFVDWLGTDRKAVVSLIRPGADFLPGDRPACRIDRSDSATVLMVGILEPRKNQERLLVACDRLWNEGADFDLRLVGRVNPHFGKPLVAEIRRLSRFGRPVEYLGRVADRDLVELIKSCRFSVFPSRAEGCGLPVLEALWMGAPCVCSDLPSHRESAAGGGCRLVDPLDEDAWVRELRVMLDGTDAINRLASEVASRSLPTWAQMAKQVVQVLSSAR